MRRLRDEVREVTGGEIRVLKAIYSLSHEYNFVPLNLIQEKVKGDVDSLTRSLAGKKLVQRRKKDYEGVRLTFTGLSMLALKTLSQKGVVDSLGSVVGVGKESVVYDALSGRYGEVVLKFHMIGAPSFKKVKEKREYYNHNWIILSSLSAKREYKCLQKLSGTVNVPSPYGLAYNAVVMERIDGRELCRTNLEDPEFYLSEILRQMREMYRMGIIHGDLSEFNILIVEDKPYFIDMPQYAESSSIIAEKLLERDVHLVLKHFRKKYGLNISVKDTIEYIRGENGRDSIWS